MTVIALPDIAAELNFSAEALLWVNIIYMMSFVAFSLPFAKIISQYGVKKSTKISLLLLFFSILISIFSINDIMFLLSRLMQGFSAAVLAISLYVIIVEEFEDSEIGSALGVVSSTGYIGLLIAPVVMGFAIFLLNWKFAFLMVLPIIAVLLILLNRIDYEWSTEKRPVDNKGSLIYVVMMCLFTYGMTILDEIGIVFVVVSFILFILLVKVEKNAHEPIFNFKLLKDVKYVIGNYAAMVTYFTVTITITVLALHLQYVLNVEEIIVSFTLLIAPIIMIGASGFSGRLSNRIDSRIISGVAMMFICASSTLFFFVDFIPFNLILVACALQGIGNGLFSAPNNKYVLTLVDEEDLPDASSVLSTSKEFGKILSSGIFTVILSIFIGNQQLGPDHIDHLFVQSANLMMFICILLNLSAVILLFYSKFRYDYAPNENTVRFFKRIAPEWAKKRVYDKYDL
ncbi:MFS transporter [uncultured Methanobrevibacter sp.]|uniref:MFS transporter n=1 Tax=uncultured Methanobrevibacter sp. TaxID=253161 RepID=UPI0025DF8D59|nr:MFS transporter [uncultured Methanobrevibacter sp.]